MLDNIFEMLANEHRRTVLMTLLKETSQSGEFTLEALNSKYVDEESTKIEMYHVHLPKLDQAGYINWNEEKHTVAKGPEFEMIRPLLTVLETHADDLSADWLVTVRTTND